MEPQQLGCKLLAILTLAKCATEKGRPQTHSWTDRPVNIEAPYAGSAPYAPLRHCYIVYHASDVHHSCVANLNAVFKVVQLTVVHQEGSELRYRLPRYDSAAAPCQACMQGGREGEVQLPRGDILSVPL